MSKDAGGQKRRHDIENIKTVIILSLFIFHACEMFYINEGFYIEGPDKLLPTLIYNFPSPWLMGVLFFLAGVTTVFSLKKRTLKEYYKNRFKMVLIPFLIGMVGILPWTECFILKNHTDYKGTPFDSYIYFFTHYSEGFLGYEGGLTPAHLWFLIYLFAISIICFPIIRLIGKKKWDGIVFDVRWLICLSIVIYVVAYGTTDESIGKFIVYFVLGILLANNETYEAYLENKWKILLILGVVINVITAGLLIQMKQSPVISWRYALMRLVWSVGNVVITFGFLGMGKVLLNRTNDAWKYLSKRSFAIYFMHMPVLIAVGYCVLKYIHIHYMIQILIMIVCSFAMTLLLVSICKRIPLINKVLF